MTEPNCRMLGRLDRKVPRAIRIPYLRVDARAECPVHQVRLADGHDAWLVLGHAAACQPLKDGRIS